MDYFGWGFSFSKFSDVWASVDWENGKYRQKRHFVVSWVFGIDSTIDVNLPLIPVTNGGADIHKSRKVIKRPNVLFGIVF